MEKFIYTKPICNEVEKKDGIRISVMSRHTENDGKTPNEKIIEGVSFSEWRKEFAPPEKLVGAYYRQEIEWEEFKNEYLNYLRSDGIKEQVKDFAKRCTEEVITLLCVEDNAEECHRHLLAEELQNYSPELKIIHK